MNRAAAVFLATCAWAGYSPVAPGTVGSLWGVAIAYLWQDISFPLQALIAAVVTIGSIYVSSEAIKIFGEKDPSQIVCDEVAGILAAFLLVPFTVVNAIMVFLLFRFFDILKPWPASLIDRALPGGAGVVLDDVAAGFYANISAHVILWFMN